MNKLLGPNFAYDQAYEELCEMYAHGRKVMLRLSNTDHMPMECIQYFDYKTWEDIIEEGEKHIFAGFANTNVQRYTNLSAYLERLPSCRQSLPKSLRKTHDEIETDKEFCKLIRAVNGFLDFHEI